MPLVRSFPPLASKNARVLILGSMPGEASLAAGQYYANPRNAFWPIAGALFGFDPGATYGKRVAALRARGIAVWDVLACCERDGSLDSNIAAASMEPNDFAAFFATHPRIGDVFCNGGTAHRLFATRVAPALARVVRIHRLPSTSPAHAGRSLAQKLAAWRDALGRVEKDVARSRGVAPGQLGS